MAGIHRVVTFLLPGVVLLTAATGCERSTEASRAALAQRRDSWARELGGLKAQQASIAARLTAPGAVPADQPAALRARAIVDGARQSITDVENQLTQAGARIEQEIRRSGQAGEKAIDDESAQARRNLQGIGEQLGAAARRVDELAGNEGETRQATP